MVSAARLIQAVAGWAERMEQLEIGSGRTRVCLTWRRWGRDLHVHVGGGDQHVGAVALAGRADDGQTYADTLCVSPHKEDRLALAAAKTLHAATGVNVCVSAGIHIDGITSAEIADVLRNVEAGIERLAGELRKPGGRTRRG